VLFVSVLAASCGGGDGPQTPTSPTAPALATLSVACPPAQSASTIGTATTVTYPSPTTTGGRAPVTVTCSPSSGASFPLGTTPVACQALDARNTAADCTFPVLVARIPMLARTRFLAFGDSTTAGEVSVPSSTDISGEGARFSRLVLLTSASYPTQLSGLLVSRYAMQSANIEVTNSGVSGEAASEGGVKRLPGVMASVRPEVVLLLEGYNDLNLYGSSGISRAIAALDKMAKEARNRGALVILASLTPPRPGGKNSIEPELVVEFNNRLRTLASGESAVYIDIYSALLPSLTTYIGVDGLHPTEAGYRRMAEEFFAAIRATLEAP
ncbi:MAG: GDSL-type esterase/lipase family protein, partial [Acidobacteriota bacterium]|nr:GDSL-type esterase/lipase family protein [Acidobacteriota bacterium]